MECPEWPFVNNFNDNFGNGQSANGNINNQTIINKDSNNENFDLSKLTATNDNCRTAFQCPNSVSSPSISSSLVGNSLNFILVNDAFFVQKISDDNTNTLTITFIDAINSNEIRRNMELSNSNCDEGKCRSCNKSIFYS
jgi:hypothetical protein